MRKKTLILLNFDSAPLVPSGHPSMVSGLRFKGEACFKDSGWHRHDNATIGCVDSGMIGIRTEEASLVASSGMVVFTPADQVHIEAGMGTAVSGWVVYLPRERVRFMPKTVSVLESTDLMMSLCKKIVSWGPLKANEKTAAQKRLVLTLLDELAVAMMANALSIPSPRRKELCLVARMIVECPEDMATIDHWAGVAGMSRRSFTMHFREETGLPFARWRQLVKLHESLKLLSSGKSVTDVSLDLGYESVSTFIAIFRKQFGLSPTKYFKNENETSAAVHKAEKRQILIDQKDK